jgi:predicted nucleic-acid-binding Zn-ribbon protein
MIFTDDKKKQIADTLTRKGANRPCERCGSQDFTVLDGYFRQEVQSDLQNVNLGGPSIPTFAVACSNCGNLSFFAAKIVSPNEF